MERGEKVEDPSGDMAVRLIKKSGHVLLVKKIVPDDRAMISEAVKEALSSDEVDVIVTSGGTGIAPSDVTIEAVKPLLEKELPGFGELLRSLSYKELGPSAILTRAVAGIAKGKAIFCLPGSPHAVELALKKLILSESSHIIMHAREGV